MGISRTVRGETGVPVMQRQDAKGNKVRNGRRDPDEEENNCRGAGGGYSRIGGRCGDCGIQTFSSL